MLTIIADAMLAATRNEKWSAPDRWKNGRQPRGDNRNEREAEAWRRRLHRDTGLW